MKSSEDGDLLHSWPVTQWKEHQVGSQGRPVFKFQLLQWSRLQGKLTSQSLRSLACKEWGLSPLAALRVWHHVLCLLDHCGCSFNVPPCLPFSDVFVSCHLYESGSATKSPGRSSPAGHTQGLAFSFPTMAMSCSPTQMARLSQGRLHVYLVHPRSWPDE